MRAKTNIADCKLVYLLWLAGMIFRSFSVQASGWSITVSHKLQDLSLVFLLIKFVSSCPNPWTLVEMLWKGSSDMLKALLLQVCFLGLLYIPFLFILALVMLLENLIRIIVDPLLVLMWESLYNHSNHSDDNVQNLHFISSPLLVTSISKRIKIPTSIIFLWNSTGVFPSNHGSCLHLCPRYLNVLHLRDLSLRLLFIYPHSHPHPQHIDINSAQ